MKKTIGFYVSIILLAGSPAICAAQSGSVRPVTPVTPPSVSAPSGIIRQTENPSAPGSVPSQRSNSESRNSDSVRAPDRQTEKTLSAAAISSLFSDNDTDFLDDMLNLTGNTRSASGKQRTSSEATASFLQQLLNNLEDIQANTESGTSRSSASPSDIRSSGGSGSIASGSIPQSRNSSSGSIASGSIPQSGGSSSSSIASGSVSSGNFDRNNSRILRFKVNGYNILDTCKTVYFSRPAADGSFLLTGDRKYVSDGVMRNETFYLLFRKSKTHRDGSVEYTVAADVSQDYLNKYSFLYQLSSRIPLSAVQTGNMIVLRTSDPSWKMDMLVDYAYNN